MGCGCKGRKFSQPVVQRIVANNKNNYLIANANLVPNQILLQNQLNAKKQAIVPPNTFLNSLELKRKILEKKRVAMALRSIGIGNR